jgi:uncharacterized Zn finger protein (UPF0148 family)
MSTFKTCPQCSQPLPERAPEGLCPECLVKVGIGSEFGGAGTPTVKGPPPVTRAKVKSTLQATRRNG